MVNRITSILVFAFAAVFFTLFGCGDDNGTNGQVHVGNAQVMVDSANNILADILYDLVNNDNIDHPDSLDFTAAYNLYLEALDSSLYHPGANFGAGLLEVLMLTQDPEFQNAYDRWEEFIDSDAYFLVDGPLSGPSFFIGPTIKIDNVSIPIENSLNITRSFCRLSLQDYPTIGEVQNILMTNILPRIDFAITCLDRVTDSTDFVFMVTGRMQGDLNEDPVELDLTEIYATLAGLSAVKAAIYQSCSYNLNLQAYSGEEMIQFLSQNSSFLSLNSVGQSRMDLALGALQGAVDYLDAGVQFLKYETDPQGDDLIFIDMDDEFTQEEFDSLENWIPYVRNSLNSSHTFTFEIDGVDEDIEISLYSFYSSPVQNLKSLFPPYQVTLDTQLVDWQNSISGQTPISATVNVGSAGYYQWSRSGEFHYGDPHYFYEYITEGFSAPGFDSAWNSMVSTMSAHPYVYMSVWYSGYIQPGQRQIYSEIYYYYSDDALSRYIPKITWDADTFEEWIFPDPTMGGLLPGMTDSRLKDLLDLTADDWQKTDVWELWWD
ncbi:MAG: hypothetical protein JSW64_01415 [Candidatus Zixiibacteriota bacterium]|nr:MAG: hypothetical protein JSW64_01415 [candidate division Zixibacteria bacterium]